MAFPKITHASLGDFEFIRLEGEPSRFGERVEVMTRAGYDGIAFRRLGQHPGMGLQRWIGIRDSDSVANLQTFEEDLMELQGEVVSVLNNAAAGSDTGATYDNMVIESIELVGPMTRHENSVGGVIGGTGTRYLRKFGILMWPTTLPS